MPVTIHLLLRQRRRRMRQVLLVVLVVTALGIGYALLVRRGIGIPCLFHTITGLRCPGCGISRALSVLAVGRIDQFLRYNPLAPLIALYIAFVGFFTAKNYVLYATASYHPPCKWVDGLVLAILLLWWVARNLFGV